MTCSNNCRGVDPNSVIIGGSAVLGAAAATGITLLQGGGLAVGTLGAAGAAALAMRQCPRGQCRVSWGRGRAKKDKTAH